MRLYFVSIWQTQNSAPYLNIYKYKSAKQQRNKCYLIKMEQETKYNSPNRQFVYYKITAMFHN